MKVYTTNGSGCFIIAIIMTLLILVIGFFGRILFTTPLGIALLIGFGVKYLLDHRKRQSFVKSSKVEFSDEDVYSNFNDDSNDYDSFDRSEYMDVEEVKDYKTID